MTIVAFNADQINFNLLLTLFNRLKGTQDKFASEVAVILENGIIPQVDSLRENAISDVVTIMVANKIERKVFADLLATEFARKYKTAERMTVQSRIKVIYELL